MVKLRTFVTAMAVMVVAEIIVVSSVFALCPIEQSECTFANDGYFNMSIPGDDYTLEFYPGLYEGQDTHVWINGTDVPVSIPSGYDKLSLVVGSDFVVNCINIGSIQIAGTKGNQQVDLDDSGKWEGHTTWILKIKNRDVSLYYDDEITPIVQYENQDYIYGIVPSGDYVLKKIKESAYLDSNSIICAGSELRIGENQHYRVVTVKGTIDDLSIKSSDDVICSDIKLDYVRALFTVDSYTASNIQLKLSVSGDSSTSIIDTIIVPKTVSGAVESYENVATLIFAINIPIIVILLLSLIVVGKQTENVINAITGWRKSVVEFIKNNFVSVISVTIAFVIALLSFDYIDCVSVTCWTLSVWDSLFDGGRILEYSAITFQNLREAPHGGDTCGFIQLLPWVIWNIPIWVTHLAYGDYSIDNPACIIWSKLFLVLCLLLSSYYVKKLSFLVTKDHTASEYGFLLCLTAGTALISVGYAGQNEIICVASFLASVYYHIKGHNILSAVLMIYSLGCFPFLVIPLLIILLIKKIGIVKSILLALIQLFLAIKIFNIGGSTSSIESYGSLTTYLDWFFYRSYIISGEGAISLFVVVLALILLYCILGDYSDKLQTTIVCMAILFISILLFSWMHFYRYYICIPAIVISLMVLYNADRNLFKIGLILFTIMNYATCIIACQDVNCWNYRYFDGGFLSNYINLDYPDNFLWVMFDVNTPLYSGLVLAGLFAACLCFVYMLIRKPDGYRKISVNDKTMVVCNTLCPILLVVAYFMIPKLASWGIFTIFAN